MAVCVKVFELAPYFSEKFVPFPAKFDPRSNRFAISSFGSDEYAPWGPDSHFLATFMPVNIDVPSETEARMDSITLDCSELLDFPMIYGIPKSCFGKERIPRYDSKRPTAIFQKTLVTRFLTKAFDLEVNESVALIKQRLRTL